MSPCPWPIFPGLGARPLDATSDLGPIPVGAGLGLGTRALCLVTPGLGAILLGETLDAAVSILGLGAGPLASFMRLGTAGRAPGLSMRGLTIPGARGPAIRGRTMPGLGADPLPMPGRRSLGVIARAPTPGTAALISLAGGGPIL